MIKLNEVFPDDFLSVFEAGRVSDSAAFAQEPFGVFVDQRRIDGAVVGDQVHHESQAQLRGLARRALELVHRIQAAGLIDEKWIELEVVFDRVQAAGAARILDWIDKHPVKTHLRRPRQMRFPVLELAGQQREQVVDSHSWARPSWLASMSLSNRSRASSSRAGGCGHCSKIAQPEKRLPARRSKKPSRPRLFVRAGPVNRVK